MITVEIEGYVPTLTFGSGFHIGGIVAFHGHPAILIKRLPEPVSDPDPDAVISEEQCAAAKDVFMMEFINRDGLNGVIHWLQQLEDCWDEAWSKSQAAKASEEEKPEAEG